MEVIELTAENIESYLADCVEVQGFLVDDPSYIRPEQVRATAQASNSYFIAIIEAGRVAGIGVVNQIVHPVRTNGYIDNIVVHGDFRGRGYFKVLMDALEGKAKDWGAEQTKLTCSRAEVQPLYEKRGYQEKQNTKYYVKEL